MRKLLIFVIALVSSTASFGAELFSDPKALVSAIYALYQPGQAAADPSRYYSSKLAALIAARQERELGANPALAAVEVMPAAGPFNPFLPDTNALLYDLVISEPTLLGDNAVITVSYHNFDQPRLLSIALVRENGGWTVDDVASIGHEDHWLLSWVLTYDPQGF